MQVLVILSVDRHRLETHPADAGPPDGMARWMGDYPSALPFQAVWAEAGLPAGSVAEIVTGYLPPPDGS